MLIIKYIPIVLAIDDLIHTVLSYYNVNADGLSYLGGISIITLIYLYISSYCFKFCEKHRIPLHYVTISNTIALYDTYFGIAVSDKQLLYIYLVLAGISIVVYLFYNQIIKKIC